MSNNHQITTFDEMHRNLLDLPATWYPGIIETAIKEAYKKKVFLPGGATVFVQGVEEKLEKEKQETLEDWLTKQIVDVGMTDH